MSEISQAIAARQRQINQLQSEIVTLQRAASIVGATGTTATSPSHPKPTPKPKAKAKQKRPAWSAADRAAISKRMKAYWAKRRKTKG